MIKDEQKYMLARIKIIKAIRLLFWEQIIIMNSKNKIMKNVPENTNVLVFEMPSYLETQQINGFYSPQMI